MSEGVVEQSGSQPTEEIARSVEKLPELPVGHVRVVHITNPEKEDSLLLTGLDYGNQGMAMSTARAWSKEEEVEVWADDPRFSYPGAKALIMDIPVDEWKMHNNLTRSDLPIAPGIIPRERIVGFVDSKKPD